MDQLELPVPETLSASYEVPVPRLMNVVEVRRQALAATEAMLAEPLRTIVLKWVEDGILSVQVIPKEPGEAPPSAPDGLACGSRAQRAAFVTARGIVRFTAACRTTLIARHEWVARGPAAAFAADLGAPVLDRQTLHVLSAAQALAALPETELTGAGDDLVAVGLPFGRWVRFDDATREGQVLAFSDGMRRFGLPEMRIGGAPALREELTTILSGVAFRLFTDLLLQAQATPRAKGLMDTPQVLRIPAEMDLYRADLDRARGLPDRTGRRYNTTIGLRFTPPSDGHSSGWLTVCPARDWDLSWGDFNASMCHALFGFEKPRWHYTPESGALVDGEGVTEGGVTEGACG